MNYLLTLALLMLCAQAQAELRVGAEQGETAVTSRDTLAVFSPAAGELWVVTAKGPLMIDREAVQAAGWKVEALKMSGGAGVKVTSAKSASWRLHVMPWGWKVLPGKGQKLPPVRLSVVMQKDGLKVDGQSVLTAQSADGRRYWVVPAAGPVRGGGEALSGLVVNADAPYKATEVPAATPVAPPKAARALPKVPVFKAVSLAAVVTPTTLVENLKEAIAQAVVAPTPPRTAYVPGTVVRFTLPPEWVFAGGRVVPAAKIRLQAAQAQAMSALEVALEQTRKVAAMRPSVADLAVPVQTVSASGVSAEVAAEVAEPVASAIEWPLAGNPTDYLPQMQRWLARIVAAPESRKQALREEFAVFNLAWGRGVEAQNALLAGGKPASSRAQLLQAFALLEQAQPAAALVELDKLAAKKFEGGGTWREMLGRWRAVALSQLGRYAEALKAWPDAEDDLLAYPAPLRNMAQLEYATALVKVGDTVTARAYADNLAQAYAAPVVPAKKSEAEDPRANSPVVEGAPPRLNLLRGMARMNGRDERDGLRILASVAEQKDDLRTAYQAKFAFVQALQRRGELAQPQYIRYLDELSRFWRGDDLEAQALRELGRQYAIARDYRAALTAWRTLVRVAPGLPDMADLTDQMTAALVGAFDPESPAAYDPLEYLGMYYDFKELVPADARGDRIAERVVDLLLQLGLPERARPVAEQLIKFGLKDPKDDPAARGRVALLLAQAQREMGDAAESLRTLDQWQSAMGTSFQQRQWQVAEARALADLGKLDSAQKVLKDRRDASVQQVRADVAWQRQDWKTLAETLRPVVRELSPGGVSGSLPLAVVKLAYAETENGNSETLEQLQKKWAGVGGDNTAAVFSTLQGTLGVTPSAVLAQQPLGQVAGSIAAAEQLTRHISRQHDQARALREDIRQYDDKMRYMELLPPPTL